ncbi:hypothetical protein [Rheinheimera mesophila]|uniref:hypothetical protein n=1 Tax=Rheinheimera mesophila TaxID=1547515 RepID=UPI00138DF3D6|nr:hypothetical protein [Rheinheimera mesophila]
MTDFIRGRIASEKVPAKVKSDAFNLSCYDLPAKPFVQNFIFFNSMCCITWRISAVSSDPTAGAKTHE